MDSRHLHGASPRHSYLVSSRTSREFAWLPLVTWQTGGHAQI